MIPRESCCLKIPEILREYRGEQQFESRAEGWILVTLERGTCLLVEVCSLILKTAVEFQSNSPDGSTTSNFTQLIESSVLI